MIKKEDGMIRLYFENINSLPITDTNWKSFWKYYCLKYLQLRLKVDLITLNETQINTALLHHSNKALDNLFRGLEYCAIMSNNCHELISTRQ